MTDSAALLHFCANGQAPRALPQWQQGENND